MEYSPPPLFKQGASARAKVAFFSLLAIVLLVADAHLHTLTLIRQAVGTVLYPLQRIALMPRDAVYGMGTYFSSLARLDSENRQLRNQRVMDAQSLQQLQLLVAENTQLRKLLGAAEQLPVKSLMAEILYDARDPFTRKIVLDRGSNHGVEAGQPVIDDIGVVGQITRVFPFTSEVTLLTDKDQAIPVQAVRSGQRSIAYGTGQSGVLDLRFMAVNADIQKDDVLVTSGIDGVYPAGLAVAKVVRVEHKSSDAFAKIVCLPAAGIDRNKQLLILLTEMKLPPRPAPEDPKEKKPVKKAAKDGAKEAAPAAAPAAAATAAPEAPKPAAPAAAAAVKPTATASPVTSAPTRAAAASAAPANTGVTTARPQPVAAPLKPTASATAPAPQQPVPPFIAPTAAPSATPKPGGAAAGTAPAVQPGPRLVPAGAAPAKPTENRP
jgi:rod shape-determining protein MreC